MYNSSRAIQLTQQWAATMDPDHFALLRHLTVRLHAGAMGRGEASVGFTGTGVIARIDGSRTYVLTAKHNLHVAGGAARVPVEQYLDTFTEKVGVEFTPRNGPAVWGAIDRIDLPDDDIGNQGYDVAVLRVNDAAFAQAARALASPGGNPSPFASEDWRKGGMSIVELNDPYTARSVVMNGQAYEGPQVQLYARYVMLQFGHGRSTPTGAFQFGQRAFPFDKLKGTKYIERTGDGYEDVFVFDTTAEISTTREGDSGGPAFAVEPSGASSFLVGVTLGANYYENRIDDDPASAIENNAFTVLNSERVTMFR